VLFRDFSSQWRNLEATVDFSKFKPSDWLKAGGGLVMLIAYFLSWWNIDGAPGGLGSVSGSEYFLTGTVPWILLVAIGVFTVLAVLDIFKLPPTFPAPLIFLAAAALSVLLILVRFFSDGFDTSIYGGSLPTSRGAGLFLALLAGIAVLAGSLIGFKESGGQLNDLKDMNKLKSQFGGGSGTGATPPPPPGGGFTPPPPPPPAGGPPPPPPPPRA
jgi:hypothetical protein